MMAELVDAHDSKSCEEIHVGSSPTRGTILKLRRVFEVNPILDTLIKNDFNVK